MTQSEAREILFKGITNHKEEIFLKYVYDGYTFVQRREHIRKSKTQRKIRKEFYDLGLSKENAKQALAKLQKLDKECK